LETKSQGGAKAGSTSMTAALSLPARNLPLLKEAISSETVDDPMGFPKRETSPITRKGNPRYR
jgi:hypothetical protein